MGPLRLLHTSPGAGNTCPTLGVQFVRSKA